MRIAGVNVGEVTTVEHLSSAAEPVARPTTRRRAREPTGERRVVTMELDEDALPLHEDATFKVRPRLFLEGNYFVDLEPGQPERARGRRTATPSALDQTAYSVQLDQVLTTLQGDVRADLQTLLDQFGNALIQLRRRRGPPRALPHLGPGAYKYTAQVNEAHARHRAAATCAA